MEKAATAEQLQFKKMTETPLPSLISSLAVPTIISMMITAVYNIADTYFVARIGTSAAGAVGIVFSIMAMIQALGFMIGVGAGSRLSRFLGKRDIAGANTCAANGFCLSLTLGTLLGTLGIVFNHELMLLTGATPHILPYAKTYAHYIFIGTPVMCASFTLNNMLRAQGNAVLGTVGLASGAVLNIFLEPLFIFTLQMGIAGAAIATLISQCVGFVVLLVMFFSKRNAVRLSFHALSRRTGDYTAILKNGTPSFCRQTLASVASVALNVSAAAYGDEAVAAMSIVVRLTLLFLSVMLGFGQGFQPVAGYNWGAGFFRRVRQGFLFCVYTETAVTAVIGMLGYSFAPEIITLFRAEDPEVIAIGALAFRFQCLAMPLQPVVVMTNMLLQSVGKSREATFLSACRQGIFFLPLIFCLVPLLGLLGVQITQTCADCLSFFVCFPILLPFLNELERREQNKHR